MKTIGLIGGTTWVSTVEYYKVINREINKRLGGANSAKILLYSVNQEEFKPPLDPHEWAKVADFFIGIARRLENAGADCLLLCANTPHMAADMVQKNIRIPLIHIAEVTGREVQKQRITKVGLLGTKITMEQPFYRDRLTKFGITTLIPGENDRDFIHTTIFAELGKEIFKPGTKKRYLDIVDRLTDQGANGIIFGCTEIPLLLKQSDCSVPVFDTTTIHSMAAVDFALSE
ncbi:MAG: aspartate/glutamate racemase family protein [Candidatus Kryptoniota bacterium]